MSTYRRPADAPISASWASHKNRNPPSSEPGTDYATAYGTPIECADAGTIVDTKTSNGSATGRYITVALDDGSTVRYLHLSGLAVARGQRVGRAQVIAYSGASGFGSDWGYGAHVHVTLWPGAAWAAPTLDFETRVGEPDVEPEPETIEGEQDMRVILHKPTGGIFTFAAQQVKYETDLYSAETVRNVTGSGDSTTTSGFREAGDREFTALCESYGVPWSAIESTRAGEAYSIDGKAGGHFWSEAFEHAEEPSTSVAQLVPPAWVAGTFLAVIAIVEIIRAIVDVIV